VGAQVLCRSKEVLSVEVLTGNVNVSRVATPSVDISPMSQGLLRSLSPSIRPSYTHCQPAVERRACQVAFGTEC